MSNTKTYFIDPATTTPQALAGKALFALDGSNALWSGASSLLAGENYLHGVEKVDTTATTLAVDVYRSKLVVSGTMTATLPNGLFEGQRKYVVCESAASTPAMTLTVTTPDATTGFACQSTFFFDTAGQGIEFIWTGAAWRALRVDRSGGTANNVVVGTTVLSSNPLWAGFYASVTGTVSSTTTKGIPNGSAVGETIQVTCSTAASIPSGTISITALTLLGAASTTLGTFGGTTNLMTLRWNGAAWTQVGSAVTLALS